MSIYCGISLLTDLSANLDFVHEFNPWPELQSPQSHQTGEMGGLDERSQEEESSNAYSSTRRTTQQHWLRMEWVA